MRVEEARRLARSIAMLDLGPGDACLNIGSSTRTYRTVDKPHIERDLMAPIEARGVRIWHCDIKADQGVDLVGDVFDPSFREQMKALHAKMLLCCNLLEHLVQPREFASACAGLVEPGGYMVVSVPFSFPKHEDPIDNMLRPTPSEIAGMFPGWNLKEGYICEAGSFLEDTSGRRMSLIRHFSAVLLPFMSKGSWFPRAHRLLWLFRRYRISVAILQKPLSS